MKWVPVRTGESYWACNHEQPFAVMRNPHGPDRSDSFGIIGGDDLKMEV